MEISLKTNVAALSTNVDKAPVRAPNSNVPTDAASAKVEINKAAVQVYQVKSQVGSDLERMQQDFDASVWKKSFH